MKERIKRSPEDEYVVVKKQYLDTVSNSLYTLGILLREMTNDHATVERYMSEIREFIDIVTTPPMDFEEKEVVERGKY